MKYFNLGRQISFLLAALFIFSNISPYFIASGSHIRRSWVIFAIWITYVVLTERKLLKNVLPEMRYRKVEISMLIFWFSSVAFSNILGRGYTGDLHLTITINTILILFCGLYYSAQNDGSFLRVCIILIMIIGAEVLRSLPFLWANTGIARDIMQASVKQEIAQEAGLASVGQYGYYTALAIVVPIFVTLALCAKGMLKYILISSVSVIVFAISISTFMGAILLMLTGAAILAVVHIYITKRRMRVFLLYMILGIAAFLAWYIYLKESPQTKYVTEKFTDQVFGIKNEGLEGDRTNRWDLWLMSTETFMEHPIIGIGPVTNRENPILHKYVGGHSSWLDQFAEYGSLFGFYLLFVLLSLKRIAKTKSGYLRVEEFRVLRYGRLISIFLYLMCGMYNPAVFIIEIYTVLAFFLLNEDVSTREGAMHLSWTRGIWPFIVQPKRNITRV